MRRSLTALAASLVLVTALSACGDGEGGAAARRIDLGSAPGVVAVGEGSVWAGTSDGLVKLDGSGDQVDMVGAEEDQEVGIEPAPAGLAVGDGAVWVANSSGGTVVKVDAEGTSVAGDRVPVGEIDSTSGVPMIAGAGGVWIGVEDSVVVLDPRTGRVAGRPIRVGGSPLGMAFAGGRVWVLIGTGTRREPVSNPPRFIFTKKSVVPLDQELVSESSRDGTLVAIDPARRRLTGARVKLHDPRDIAAGLGALWASDGVAVRRLDPATGRPSGPPIRVGESVDQIAVGEDAVWVNSPQRNAVFRVDPGDRQVSDPIVMETENAEGVSAEVGEIAVGLGAVWIGSELEPALARIDASAVD